MPVRSADAVWDGTLREGAGTMRLRSGAYEGPYTWGTRFGEDEGSNPDELLGAALAGCFSMALSGDLEKAGHNPGHIATTAEVHVTKNESGGFGISRIDLRSEAQVDATQEQLEQVAETTKRNCPVSRVLTGTQITLEIKLAG